MKECKQFEKLLPGYLHGELYEKEYHALRAHLENCPACRSELEALRVTLEMAGRVMAAVPTPPRMSAWRCLPRKQVDLRTNLFSKIWYSPQFKAALATGALASFFIFFSGLFVVFSVVHKSEVCFEAPVAVQRPRMTLKKLQVPASAEQPSAPKLRKNIVASSGVATVDFMMPEINGVSAGVGHDDAHDNFGLGTAGFSPAEERPLMELKKPKVAVAKGAQPKPSSRIVAKVKTASMPDIQLPDLEGTGEGLFGDAGGSVEIMDKAMLEEVGLLGHAVGGMDEAPVYFGRQLELAADARRGSAVELSKGDSYNFRFGFDDAGEAETVATTETVSLYSDPFAMASKSEVADFQSDWSGSAQQPLQDHVAQAVVPADGLVANYVRQDVWDGDRLAGMPASGNTPLGIDDLFGGEGVEIQSMLGYSISNGEIAGQEVWAEPMKEAPPAGLVDEWKPVEPEPAKPPRERMPAFYNPYVLAADNPFSTFSIDVDTASYGLVRQQLLDGALPDTEVVRTEEFVNSFDYDYRPPAGSQTFAVHTEMAPSPFRSRMELLKIGVKGRRIGRDDHRGANLTLVIDTSGSMSTPERLGLVKQSLSLLLDQLNPEDRVAIIQFGGDARLVCEHTPVGDKAVLREAVDALQAGGPTQFDRGLELGYRLATSGFVAGDSNRILILSDGVANLGELDPQAILEQVSDFRKKGIYLSVLGFGAGAYDDEMLEQLANRGDGTYAYVDTLDEARHLFVDQLAATLHVIASDVKIQVEFDPARVVRYRQIGYENRQLTKEQFRDDTVDAGEVGSGQSVTALYEVELQADGQPRDAIATVYVRYRRADNGVVEEIGSRVTAEDRIARFEDAGPRFQLAACVAEFAERLRRSPYADGTEMAEILDRLRPAVLALDLDAKVQELQRLISIAAGLEN